MYMPCDAGRIHMYKPCDAQCQHVITYDGFGLRGLEYLPVKLLSQRHIVSWMLAPRENTKELLA